MQCNKLSDILFKVRERKVGFCKIYQAKEIASSCMDLILYIDFIHLATVTHFLRLIFQLHAG